MQSDQTFYLRQLTMGYEVFRITSNVKYSNHFQCLTSEIVVFLKVLKILTILDVLRSSSKVSNFVVEVIDILMIIIINE